MSPRDCEDVDSLVPGDVWKGETAAVSELPLPDQSGVGGRDRGPQAPRDHRAGPESGHGKPVRGILSAGTRLYRDGAQTPGRLSFGNQRTRPDSIFTLSESDLEFVRQQRGDHNRLGFALQLCALRYLGFCPDDIATAPSTPIAFGPISSRSLPGRFTITERDLRLGRGICNRFNATWDFTTQGAKTYGR